MTPQPRLYDLLARCRSALFVTETRQTMTGAGDSDGRWSGVGGVEWVGRKGVVGGGGALRKH